MPKIKMTPVDHGPIPERSTMIVKLLGLVMMSLALFGVMYILLTFSWEDESQQWEWAHQDIRTNFHKQMTTDQIEAEFQRKREEWQSESGVNEFPEGFGEQEMSAADGSGKEDGPGLPFGNDGDDLPPPSDDRPRRGTDQREEIKRDTAIELKIAEKLNKDPVFDLASEAQKLADWVPFRDASIELTMNEWTAYQGRQAPGYERMALGILRGMSEKDHSGKVHNDGWYFGKSQEAVNVYRGLGFAAEGRLFDLYAIEPDEPIVLNDGTKIERYYEGAVALLGPGYGRGEHKIEHRVVLFQTLEVPSELQPYVSTESHVSHEDKLVTEAVMVKLSGAYLRRWVYNREVMPYSTKNNKVLSQAHAPLLLTTNLDTSDMTAYELTDELLQQVRDAYRDDPVFLETEAAYYAMLAKANRPDDEINVIDEIGYFDLAGDETGPKYRGQGIRVVGMVGDNYAPVILPPNIAGLRRVFRVLVLHDTSDLESPKRYMVDMVEPPTNLGPRAIVDFEARYYRNVFETDSTRSAVRPLLIVRRITGIGEEDEGDEWIYALLGVVGVMLLLSVLTVFVISERRERARFEQSTLELSQKRMKDRGGLKLKPLPGPKGGSVDPTAKDAKKPEDDAPPPADKE